MKQMKPIKLDSNAIFVRGRTVVDLSWRKGIRKSKPITFPVNKEAVFSAHQAWMVWYNSKDEMMIKLIKDRNHTEGTPWPKARSVKNCSFICNNLESLLTSDDELTRTLALEIANLNASITE